MDKSQLWLFVLVATVPSLPGKEAFDCRALILDQATVLSPTDRQQLEGTADRLTNKGADVHILTAHIPADSTLEEVARNAIRDCPSWQAPESNDSTVAKDELLLLAVAPTERKSGIYFGARWAPALDTRYQQIMADAMNPHFRQHEFGGGLLAAEKQIADGLEAAQLTPQPSTTNGAPASLPASSTASNSPQFPPVLKWLLPGALAFWAIVIALVIRNRRQTNQAGSQTAEQSNALGLNQTATEIGSQWKPEYTAGTTKSYPAPKTSDRRPSGVTGTTVNGRSSSARADGDPPSDQFVTGLLLGNLLSPSHHASVSEQSSSDSLQMSSDSSSLGGGSSDWGSSGADSGGGSSDWSSSSSDSGSSFDGGSSSW